MIIFPAIDIKDGKVVRLAQGKFDQMTEYDNSPVTIAKNFEKDGAKWLHVVDLDGAKTGEIKNLKTVLDIAKAVSIPIQMGGGVRQKKDVETLIAGGVKRVILGTRAIEDRQFLKDLLKQWPDKIAVSLDCKDGFVAQRGWVETSTIKGTDLAKELESYGLRCVIYTDVARDGMLTGPNMDGLKAMLKAVKIPLIASGGVSNLDDIKQLKHLEKDGLIGAITGKALYEGKLKLKEALKII